MRLPGLDIEVPVQPWGAAIAVLLCLGCRGVDLEGLGDTDATGSQGATGSAATGAETGDATGGGDGGDATASTDGSGSTGTGGQTGTDSATGSQPPPGGTDSDPCDDPDKMFCGDDGCVDVTKDEDHCGGCGEACGERQECIERDCVDDLAAL